jgi:ABC-type branched-subunit amino acid transport system ATPase component
VPGALVVRGLCKRFGGLAAVQDCAFEVAPGQVVGLIGPNGSGKSTVFNLITGVIAPDAGAIEYDGRSLIGLALHRVAGRGIGRTFQEVKIFRELPVWQNLAISALGRRLAGWQDRGAALLADMGLDHLRDELGENLSIGQQRLLELTMQLLVQPDLLLLDEPLAGVHPVVRNRIAGIIRAQRAAGRAILLIEHDMRFVMELCDRLVVMDHGEKIADGPPGVVRADPRRRQIDAAEDHIRLSASVRGRHSLRRRRHHRHHP